MMERRAFELFWYVTTPEENERYSDEEIKRKYLSLGYTEVHQWMIDCLRGKRPWDSVPMYE